MNREEVIAFVNKNKEFFLATVEEGRPRVRGMSVFLADGSGLYFCTGKPKAVYAQLKACPAVELCFFSPEQMTQLRVRGTVEESDDVALKKQAIEAFPFLKPIAERVGYEPFAIFRLREGESATWTMGTETSEEPAEFVPF